MSNHSDLLVVDDEVQRRVLISQILTMRGYQVRIAEDGFQALSLIRSSVPKILLSDLNMPGMSGFELLSVVRRLYPRILVVATSGAYSGTQVPTGIAADAFYEKASGMASLFELLEIIADTERALICSKRLPTPLWVDLEPRVAFEPNHVLINCPQCMRAFSEVIEEVNSELRATECRYCGGLVRFAIAVAAGPLPASAMGKSTSVRSSTSASHVCSQASI